MRKLIILDQLAFNSDPHCGGSILLPENIKWPRDPKNNPMILIASFPAKLLTFYKNIPCNIFCSFFVSYDPKDYDRLIWMADTYSNHRDGSRLIVHELSNSPRMESLSIINPARTISIEEDIETDTEWVQDEITIDNMEYLFELSGYDIEDAFPGNRGIWRDGVGYFFASTNLGISDDAGYVLLQDT